MDEEQWSVALPRCCQADRLRARATSRGVAAALRGSLVALELDGDRFYHNEARSLDWEALGAFLRAHPRVRRLSLRGRRVRAEELAGLLRATPSLASCDVTFALPLQWPAFGELCRRPELGRVRFSSSLTAEPAPALRPSEVVIAQAYGLHCGRVDVCFRFASPALGPLERFEGFFEPPSRYSVMLECSAFSLGAEEWDPPRPTCVLLVSFTDGVGRQQFFRWELSLQRDRCWMTDGVVPVDYAGASSMWDGSMLEE